MDIKCFGDGGQSHKCHLSASSLSRSLAHCWLWFVSLRSPAASRPARRTHLNLALSRLDDEGFTHRRAHLKNCTLYPPQLACTWKRRDCRAENENPLARNKHTGKIQCGERERDEGDLVQRGREREMLHDRNFNCSWFCNAIHIHSVTHPPSAVWSRRTKVVSAFVFQ